ncbi:MAG: DUF2817 domain-containing protein [Acidobacteria bacterium]|nr:MAG: DUF2817 domain-containing protein [Acidobacteriota bacterium]
MTDYFPATYATARQGFISEAEAAGAQITSHAHPLDDPSGEELAIDVARFGSQDAAAVVVIGSGTHGVEGRCGSGLQRIAMREGLFTELPKGVGVILVHGINPFGFAWDRRVDHNNIDVNRNFVDHAGPYPDNDAYEALFDVLNPAELDDSQAWTDAITEYASAEGPIAAYRASVGGQYIHPEGLQYGGAAPTWSNEVLTSVWRQELGKASLAINVDFHTGIGPPGFGSVMQTANVDEDASDLASQWWGGIMRSARPESADPITCGLVGLGFDETVNWAQTVSIVLEFGTRDPLEVLGAIRADNWLEQYGDRRSEKGKEIGEQMRAAFFVDDPVWRDKVTERGLEVMGQAIEGAVGS